MADASGLAAAYRPRAGHFEELFGSAISDPADAGAPSGWVDAWSDFFATLKNESPAALKGRVQSLQRQLRDNGVSYNVYADESGPQRPWALDLFPLLITPQTWHTIEAGIQQRMRLLELLLDDVYGAQKLVQQGLLPAALVHGNPGYMRAMQGVLPLGQQRLQIAAFDLARGPDGNWWMMSQRCQAPSGLGYLLENRLTIAAQFPEAFASLNVQRLAGSYRAWVQHIQSLCPAGGAAHIALLTPGPYNETYFEHAYLARYLGLTLVEGSDLVVRDEKLYLKTVHALVQIDGLIKRVDDQYLDPLELRPDSTLGIPGLLQAVRAGHLVLANSPGTAVLESPALLGFLPGLSRHLLGEDLQLPSLHTWWCGEDLAMQEVLPQLEHCVIKATYPGSAAHPGFETALGHQLSPGELKDWQLRMAQRSDEYTVQAHLPLAQMPTWQPEARPQLQPRSYMLRVFALADGRGSWRVLPGGLVRLAGDEQSDVVSMQRGGSSADAWVLSHEPVDIFSLLSTAGTPKAVMRKRLVTSRSAENLFWMGRYTERTENAVRLSRVILENVRADQTDQGTADLPMLNWLSLLAVRNALVLPAVPSAALARRVFERALLAGLPGHEGAGSVGRSLSGLRVSASAVRERLSQEQWRMIALAEETLNNFKAQQTQSESFAAPQALGMLRTLHDQLAAITGVQTDRMTRDDGWSLLSIGRLVERLAFFAEALRLGLQARSLNTTTGFDAMLSVFDSTITFHAQFQQQRHLASLLDLLVLDQDNPRALACITQTLSARLDRLSKAHAGEQPAAFPVLPEPTIWRLEQLCEPEPSSVLNDLLQWCASVSWDVSDAVAATYFSHANGLSSTVVS